MLPRLANTDVPWKCNRQPSHISQLDLFTPTNFENASTAEWRTHHHIIQAKTTLRAEIDKRNRSFYHSSPEVAVPYDLNPNSPHCRGKNQLTLQRHFTIADHIHLGLDSPHHLLANEKMRSTDKEK
jgi:hypothetical protein